MAVEWLAKGIAWVRSTGSALIHWRDRKDESERLTLAIDLQRQLMAAEARNHELERQVRTLELQLDEKAQLLTVRRQARIDGNVVRVDGDNAVYCATCYGSSSGEKLIPLRQWAAASGRQQARCGVCKNALTLSEGDDPDDPPVPRSGFVHRWR